MMGSVRIEYLNSGLEQLNRELAAAFSAAGELSAEQMSACRWAVLDMPGAAETPNEAQKELVGRLEEAHQTARRRQLDQIFGWCMVAAQAAAVGRIDWGHQDDSALSAMADFLHEVAPPPARVLDVAAGTGRCSLPMAAQGYDISLFDPTAGFLELAAANERPGALLCGTFADLPALPDDAYDACLCIGSIFYLPSPQHVEQAVGQLARIASNCVVFNVTSKLGTILQLGTDDADCEFSPNDVEQFLDTGITPPAKPENGRVIYSCFSAAELRRVVEAAGMQLQQLVGIGPSAEELPDILTQLGPQQRTRINQLLTGDDAPIDRAPRFLAICTKAN